MVIIFNENEEEYKAVKRVPKKTKSSFSKWLVKMKVAKTESQGEAIAIFFIFIVFVIAGIIYSLGVGINKVKDLEENSSEYLQ